MRMKTLYDFETERVYISKNLNNGDWNYRLAIKVLNLQDYDSDFPNKWDVSIQAVSPEAAGDSNVNKAVSSMGLTDEDIARFESDYLLYKFEALLTYGIFAQLWNRSGNNLESLLKEARKELPLIEGLFGFYMDRPENGIGQDGWSLIAGQDLREFFAQRSQS